MGGFFDAWNKCGRGEDWKRGIIYFLTNILFPAQNTGSAPEKCGSPATSGLTNTTFSWKLTARSVVAKIPNYLMLALCTNE